MSFLKKLGLVTECANCSTRNNVLSCPHCSQKVCHTCLSLLVNKSAWPDWMKGRKADSFEDLKTVVGQYIAKVQERGGSVHACTEFLNYRWKGIEDYQNKMKSRLGNIESFTFK